MDDKKFLPKTNYLQTQSSSMYIRSMMHRIHECTQAWVESSKAALGGGDFADSSKPAKETKGGNKRDSRGP